MKISRFLLASSCAVLLVTAGRPAFAGPPFVTDDPEPVEYGKWEINSAFQTTYVKGAHGGSWPTIDANYGPFEDTQFHFNLSTVYTAEDGHGTHAGFGDSEIGVKYRFVHEDEEGWQPQIAIYPNIDFPTGTANRGLGAGHTRVLLPIWVQKSFGDWTTYGGGGYWINQGNNSQNYWTMSWAVLRKINEDWTLGVEAYHNGADLRREAEGGSGVSTRASTSVGFGGYYNFDEDNHFIFNFGRGVQNANQTNQFYYYVGFQNVF